MARVLFSAPWFRTIAQLYGRHLQDMGHEVLIVTTERHFEAGYGFCREIVLPGVGSPSNAVEYPRALRAVREFEPDVCLVEETGDPRFLPLVRMAPHASLMIHDAQRHDVSHRLPRRTVAAYAWEWRSITHKVCFSAEVSRRISEHYAGRRRQPVISRWPLLSELPEPVPSPRQMLPRRGFVTAGRVSEYKNYPRLVEAWRYATKVRPELLDEGLTIYAGGIQRAFPVTDLPPGISIETGVYELGTLATELPRYRAFVMPYIEASQSGVQVLALQCGLPPIISGFPGLLEYQGDLGLVVDPLDVHSIGDTMLRLAGDDVLTADLAARARPTYERFSGTPVVRSALASWLDTVLG